MTDDRVRLEIGFGGGQIVGLQTTVDGADRLERHLASGADGTVELEFEDGRCVVVCARVVYVKRFSRQSRVGFGSL